jgi:glycosyltransferase involved in cell wall biosynthesis
MISLVITNYNRSDLVIEAFSKVLNNDYINEILIVDDCSDINIFNKLKDLINNLKNEKIKLIRNEKNLKPFLNKCNSIKQAKNEWVILLDSDNILDNDYIDKIKNLKNIDKNTVYVPEKLMRENFIGWDYSSLKNKIINKDNVKYYYHTQPYSGIIDTLLNTGNYFINRDEHVKATSNINIDESLSVNDALYFSFLWLSTGNNIFVVDDLKYYHRVHQGSWYINNMSGCQYSSKRIAEKINVMI